MRQIIVLATSLAVTALAPSVGVVQKGNRKITVIGTAHTPSRRQREEVEALIAEVKPDAVLVELDAERLEFAWNQPEEAYGGELAAAVRAARSIDAPVVLGDACRPLPAVVEARPLFDLERTRRAWRLLVRKPVAVGVDVERIDDCLHEYLEALDAAEAAKCLQDLHVPFFMHEVVKRALTLAIEHGGKAPKAVLDLLAALSESGMVTSNQMARGFARVSERLPDLVLDVPGAPKHYGDLRHLGGQVRVRVWVKG